MIRLILLLPLAGACAPRSVPPPAREVRWVPVEAAVARLDYPAGDAAVSEGARVLVLAPAPSHRDGRRAPPTLRLPARVEVGEIFSIEIRVPRAADDEIRHFRVRCGRPGLRLLDGDRVVTRGRDASRLRAIADSPGPAAFDLEDAGD